MSYESDFSGKVVLITGSSSGIGAVTAADFSRCGAQVVITGRNSQNLSEVAELCRRVSPNDLKPLEVVADIGKEDDCKRLIETTIKTFGRIDVMVNSEGVGAVVDSIYDPNYLETIDNLLNTNLHSDKHFAIQTHVWAKYSQQNNISSLAALKPVNQVDFNGNYYSIMT